MTGQPPYSTGMSNEQTLVLCATPTEATAFTVDESHLVMIGDPRSASFVRAIDQYVESFTDNDRIVISSSLATASTDNSAFNVCIYRARARNIAIVVNNVMPFDPYPTDVLSLYDTSHLDPSIAERMGRNILRGTSA